MKTKTYSVLYAEDVPHYATGEIRAQTDGEAITLTLAHPWTGELHEADWQAAVNRRIVHIEAEDGSLIATDVPLDADGPHALVRGLYEALILAREALEATSDRPLIYDDALRAVIEAITLCEGGAS